MQPKDDLTRDEKVKIIKYMWRNRIVFGESFESVYDVITKNNKPLFESIVEAGYYSEKDRESFNAILTDIDSLRYDYGVAIEIDKWKQIQTVCGSSVVGNVKSLAQTKITDEILIYLFNNDAIHNLKSEKENKFVSLEQLIFFFLEKYGTDLITPE